MGTHSPAKEEMLNEAVAQFGVCTIAEGPSGRSQVLSVHKRASA